MLNTHQHTGQALDNASLQSRIEEKLEHHRRTLAHLESCHGERFGSGITMAQKVTLMFLHKEICAHRFVIRELEEVIYGPAPAVKTLSGITTVRESRDLRKLAERGESEVG